MFGSKKLLVIYALLMFILGSCSYYSHSKNPADESVTESLEKPNEPMPQPVPMHSE
jgi:hypothetical protein